MHGGSDESPTSFLDVWSVSALLVLVVATYGPAAMLVSPPIAVTLGVLGALYSVTALAGARHLERVPGLRSSVLVFGAQIAIALASAVLSGGQTLLAPLAIASLAVLYLPPLGRTIVIAAVALIIGGGVIAYAATPTLAAQAIVGAFSAGAFVVAFSHLALSRHRARIELARAHAQLRAQTAQIALLAAEQERLHLAREIHDSVGHWLVSAHVHLEVARSVAGADVDACRSAIESAAGASREALAEVRQSVRALRVPASLGAPVAERIGQIVDDAARAGLGVTFRDDAGEVALRPEVELTLFRVAQEALTNVRRHAAARRIDVALEGTPERVVLTVEDDGAGFAEGAIDAGARPDGSGQGLRGMAERVESMGGRLSVRSSPGAGARLRVELPR